MPFLAIAGRSEYIDNAWKTFTNNTYLEKIGAYGWTPFIIPHTNDALQIAMLCDALLIPGGYDIAPAYFHQKMDSHATLYQQPIDHLDLSLIDAFVTMKKPILGICRGIQIINVYFQGTIDQHIKKSIHEESEHQHTIYPLPNTLFDQLLLPAQQVNSFHHQCIEQLGDGLCLGAISKDMHIEAIFHEELPILGVQWHPERMENDTIFPYFLDVLTRI